MINVEQMSLILEALPDPAFILSRSGKYVAVFGGRDTRYYHINDTQGHHAGDKIIQFVLVEGTPVTASIGVTAIAPEDRSYEDTLKRADRALYKAKSMGKDRIVLA